MMLSRQQHYGIAVPLAVIAMGALTLPRLAAGQYVAGFTWQRSTDWTVQPNSDQGTTVGNPSPDSVGNPVWSYEWVQGGGGLSSGDPWYEQPSQKMVWNPNWYGIGYPVWDQGYDDNPMVTQTYLLQNVNYAPPVSNPDQTPLVRWIDPMQQSTLLNIAGTLQVTWGGSYLGYPINIDLVIAEESPSGAFNTLLATTVSKPHDNISTESLDLPVNTSAIVNPGDSLVFSLKADGEYNGWVYMNDPLTLTVVSTRGETMPYDGHTVGLNDLNNVLNNFGTYNPQGYAWPDTAANDPEPVGLADVDWVLDNFGTGGNPAIELAPEPSSMGILAVGVMGILMRRGKK